jgi:feruloyl esterase
MAKAPDPRADATRPVEDFYRLFMVPGMEHCGGGAGPDDFGEAGPGTGDAQHSIDTQLKEWVLNGAAPNVVIASKHASDHTVTRTRPVCAYPAVAHYKGAGSTDDAANFTCAIPDSETPGH